MQIMSTSQISDEGTIVLSVKFQIPGKRKQDHRLGLDWMKTGGGGGATVLTNKAVRIIKTCSQISNNCELFLLLLERTD